MVFLDWQKVALLPAKAQQVMVGFGGKQVETQPVLVRQVMGHSGVEQARELKLVLARQVMGHLEGKQGREIHYLLAQDLLVVGPSLGEEAQLEQG
jgi:hypothetical protein